LMLRQDSKSRIFDKKEKFEQRSPGTGMNSYLYHKNEIQTSTWRSVRFCIE